jgi:chromosomal replication initiation ATPase DnaA
MDMDDGRIMDLTNLHKPLQYTLPIIQQPDFTSYSFFVSDSNRIAYELIERWPNWSFKQYVICAPSGYGKTHLGHILKDRIEGEFFNAKDITQETLLTIRPNNNYVLDDIQLIDDPKLLFHFYNLTLENHCTVIYLSEVTPGRHDMKLADLNSRLRTLPVIELTQPDDELCKAIIKKVFADLQINLSEDVVNYILAHTSRSLTDMQSNLQLINQRSLEEKRSITIPFIKLVLDVK